VLSELDSAPPFENPIIALIDAPWADPVTETPRAGSVEIWRIINTTGGWLLLQGYLVGADMHRFLDIVFNGTSLPKNIIAFYSFTHRAIHGFDGAALMGHRDCVVPVKFWRPFSRARHPATKAAVEWRPAHSGCATAPSCFAAPRVTPLL